MVYTQPNRPIITSANQSAGFVVDGLVVSVLRKIDTKHRNLRADILI